MLLEYNSIFQNISNVAFPPYSFFSSISFSIFVLSFPSEFYGQIISNSSLLLAPSDIVLKIPICFFTPNFILLLFSKYWFTRFFLCHQYLPVTYQWVSTTAEECPCQFQTCPCCATRPTPPFGGTSLNTWARGLSCCAPGS